MNEEQLREHNQRLGLRKNIIALAREAFGSGGFLPDEHVTRLSMLIDEAFWDDLYAVLDELNQEETAHLICALNEVRK